MRNVILLLAVALIIAACSGGNKGESRIVTVSIAPFRYFVESVAGDDFTVNVMVPPGADPHIYEPVPGQVAALSRSEAYISNGNLGFEIAWLDRFHEANRDMVKLALGEEIQLIEQDHHHHDHGQIHSHAEEADPHFWISPRSAAQIAASVKNLLSRLNPDNQAEYEENYRKLSDTISYYDRMATDLLAPYRGRSFMIFHPALGYLARDYGLNQIAVENEGKEPTPSYMKQLIDEGRRENVKIIFIQKGFDTKNAGAIASEIGAGLMEIDPLAEDWTSSVSQIIRALEKSFANSTQE